MISNSYSFFNRCNEQTSSWQFLGLHGWNQSSCRRHEWRQISSPLSSSNQLSRDRRWLQCKSPAARKTPRWLSFSCLQPHLSKLPRRTRRRSNSFKHWWNHSPIHEPSTHRRPIHQLHALEPSLQPFQVQAEMKEQMMLLFTKLNSLLSRSSEVIYKFKFDSINKSFFLFILFNFNYFFEF